MQLDHDVTVYKSLISCVGRFKSVKGELNCLEIIMIILSSKPSSMKQLEQSVSFLFYFSFLGIS
jgi:hypothetical protein